MRHHTILSSAAWTVGVTACLAACSTGRVVPASGASPVSASPTPTAAATAAVPTSVRWTRASAEHRALFLEIYGLAADQLQHMAASRQPGSWGVIMDADETLIDNSPYEQQLAQTGTSYTESSWATWVRREAAAALPGAVAFTHRVHELGGRVVVVTGRADALCAETRANLEHVGIVSDEVLCQVGSSSDKKPRFDAVQRGAAPSVLPAMDVLMWVGDNIQDFPHASQALRTQPDQAFASFGRSFILLPDPMYGSWEKNPLPPLP